MALRCDFQSQLLNPNVGSSLNASPFPLFYLWKPVNFSKINTVSSLLVSLFLTITTSNSYSKLTSNFVPHLLSTYSKLFDCCWPWWSADICWSVDMSSCRSVCHWLPLYLCPECSLPLIFLINEWELNHYSQFFSFDSF